MAQLIDRDDLTQSIVNKQAKIPDILQLRDFEMWLDGYTACQHDILDIVADAPTVEQPEPVKPKRESRAMLPCKCGSKRREHWCGWDSGESHEALKCCRCGFKVIGKNATDVIRQWNKAIQEASENG